MDPIKAFEWWHDAVFGRNPIREAIPPEILRGYLDALEAERFDNKTRVRVTGHA